MNLQQFQSRNELNSQLTEDIVAQLNSAIENRGCALLAVSGGNSPKPVFEKLSQQAIDWSKVTITLVDERWVDDTHPDSNAKLVKDYLLQNDAASAKFIPLYNGKDSPFEAQAEIDQQLKELNFPFDAVILGLGEDGHTASFFPKADNLQDAIDVNSSKLCCAIEPITAPHARMTFTLAPLLNSQHIFLLVTGASKLPILKQAMNSFKPQDDHKQWLKALPIRTVLHQYSKPVSIYYAD